MLYNFLSTFFFPPAFILKNLDMLCSLRKKMNYKNWVWTKFCIFVIRNIGISIDIWI